jgi:hypothetical protein
VEVDALVQYYDEFTAAEKIDKIVSHQEEISLNVPEGETKGFDGQDLAGVEAEPDDYEVVISWASSIKELDT